eukprot:gnl/TRDRNA2_/TRDRNA2_177217_c0_seq24.p1 gnl/TRDRNA2_/TRDRNA2_177217_c0~~gnl/TRDRNA2_/TRDRNA2_177217_c0_seq24.p1  ORF type:complete len:111 (+),score=1.29 gnl/TRDRNA2_/TRDRNA2_177217_c0_seq24:83-415(+)
MECRQCDIQLYGDKDITCRSLHLESAVELRAWLYPPARSVYKTYSERICATGFSALSLTPCRRSCWGYTRTMLVQLCEPMSYLRLRSLEMVVVVVFSQRRWDRDNGNSLL